MDQPKHAFYADTELGRDWRGAHPCASCGLPKRNEIHEMPERPADDVTERIVGEQSGDEV